MRHDSNRLRDQRLSEVRDDWSERPGVSQQAVESSKEALLEVFDGGEIPSAPSTRFTGGTRPGATSPSRTSPRTFMPVTIAIELATSDFYEGSVVTLSQSF